MEKISLCVTDISFEFQFQGCGAANSGVDAFPCMTNNIREFSAYPNAFHSSTLLLFSLLRLNNNFHLKAVTWRRNKKHPQNLHSPHQNQSPSWWQQSGKRKYDTRMRRNDKPFPRNKRLTPYAFCWNIFPNQRPLHKPENTHHTRCRLHISTEDDQRLMELLKKSFWSLQWSDRDFYSGCDK